MSKNNYYNNALIKFLRKHKTIPEKEFTHTSIPGESNGQTVFAGKYCIKDEDLDTFYKIYNNHVFKLGLPAHLTEKHKDQSPVLIDLDFRHKPTKDNERQYDDKFLNDFLKLYFNEMENLIGDVIEEKNKVAYILEKKNPIMQQSKNILKDGIHIIMPKIVTEPKVQYLLRYKCLENPAFKELLDSINSTNPPDDVFDIAVIERNNWQMYGSCKPGNIPYKVTKIISKKGDELVNEKVSDDGSKYVKFLSIRSYNKSYKIDTTEIDENIEEQFQAIQKSNKQRSKKST